MGAGVVIAGAGLAGLRAAEQLRARGYAGPITVVGAEQHPPYTRPPLSKELLRADHADRAAALASVAFRQRPTVADVTWCTGCAVVGASLTDRVVRLADGRELPYAGLVIATGLAPRRLPLPGREADRLVLRTLDDALALRERLAPGTRVAIIGGGFIGCEVAATATALGCTATVIEALDEPMLRAIGAPLGAAVRGYHGAHGIAIHVGHGIARIGDAVELADGTAIPADVIVESVGAAPCVDWLAGTGLDLADGVRCDDRLRVEGLPDVVAAGDIARFPDRLLGGRARRVEHWSMPADTARRAAATLAAHLAGAPVDDDPFAPLPTFWSDQGALRLQAYGVTGLGEDVTIAGSLSDVDAGVALAFVLDGTVVGTIAAGFSPPDAVRFRALVGQPADALPTP